MTERTLNRQVRRTLSGTRKRAVRYLRVSTDSQYKTDFNPEGISIPAQRMAVDHKAETLGADIVDEYVEPGRTGTSIEKRPRFQEMMARIKTRRDIDYIIVYTFSRIFRNNTDAAIIKRDLKKLGVRVVSCIVDLGESPEATMVESIIHAVDQYQSEASGADIRYKMGEKAKHGGTISRTQIGYLNVTIQVEDRTIRTVALDNDPTFNRAGLISQAFELFATGQYTGQELLDLLTQQGLRTRGTRRRPPKPLSLSRLYAILSDRYYLGKINYQGVEYEGRHEPLTTPEIFNRVQRVLALRGGGGTRQRTHNHYLKGALWCGRCGSRIILTPGTGNGGRYFYFLCRGRQKGSCDQPYLPVETVARRVVAYYATVRLSDQFQAQVRDQLEDIMLSELGSLDGLRKRLKARLEELDATEDRYLDLVGKPGWPEAKLQARLVAIQDERAKIHTQLEDTSSTLETGRSFFLAALDLLTSPQAFYERAGTSLRRAMNKLIFDKLYINGEDITGHELTEVAGPLIQADTAYRAASQADAQRVEALDTPDNANSPLTDDGAAYDLLTGADLLGVSLAGHGSSRAALVGDAGIEPATSSV